jgi:Gluconate 2-dehydrogenase subunit 3
LATTGTMGLLALAPPARVGALLAEARAAGRRGRFLTAAEMVTLTALCDRLIPGPPEDSTPGAVQAGVPGAIDLLLGAFELEPPLIYAGGPFSNRAGSKRDDFAHFVQLDRQEVLAWRIRLEGSRGLREREFAGPVKGLQEIYREGLAVLDARARKAAGVGYAQASTTVQDQILATHQEKAVQSFLGAALANTLEAMYGPPEYGGNRNLVGWTSNDWPGDQQPRGSTRAQVTQPDAGSAAPDAVIDVRALGGLAGRPAPREAWWLGRRRMGR